MLRLALVSPPYGVNGESMAPLSLVALKAYIDLHLGDEVRTEVFDFSDSSPDAFELLDEYGVPDSDIVGFCAYSTNFLIAARWARELKARRPDALTVVGGPHPTALAEHVVAAHGDAFDFAVRGEGELPLRALVEARLKSSRPRPTAPGLVYKTALGVQSFGTAELIKNLDTLPSPVTPVRSPRPYEMRYGDTREARIRRAAAMTSSRGCPFSCSFCSISTNGSRWRGVSAEHLRTWIEDTLSASDQPIEHIYFMDADFLINRRRAVAIGDMFEASFPQLTWSFSARVDDLQRLGEPALIRMAGQGLRAIESGLESGSQAALDRMNKGVTIDDNLRALSLLRRAGLDITVDFILFLPDTTPEHLRESLQFLHRAGLTEEADQGHFYTSLSLYPGTPLRPYYEKEFGAVFDLDVLPEPDELFLHESTRLIHRYLVRDFAPYAQQLPRLIQRVDRASIFYESSNPRLAQRLRIESLSLRHIPFLVLDRLIDHWSDGGLLEAVPWLREFDEYVEELLHHCAGVPSQPMDPAQPMRPPSTTRPPEAKAAYVYAS